MLKIVYGEDLNQLFFEAREDLQLLRNSQIIINTEINSLYDYVSQVAFIEEPKNYFLVFSSSKEYIKNRDLIIKIKNLNENSQDMIYFLLCDDFTKDDIFNDENILKTAKVNKSYVSKYIKNYFQRRKFKITDESISEIVSRIPYDMNLVKKEIEKLELHWNEEKVIDKDSIDKIISPYYEYKIIYDVLISFVLERENLQNIYEAITNEKIEPIQILYTMYGELLALSEFKQYSNKNDFFSKNNIPSFKMKNFLNLDKKLSNQNILEIMNDLIEIEMTIKTSNVSAINIFKLLDIMIRRYSLGK